MLPVAEFACIVLKKLSSSTEWTNQHLVQFPVIPPGFASGTEAAPIAPDVPPPLVELADEYRSAYCGVTAHLNAPRLSDQGVLYASQWAAVPQTDGGLVMPPPYPESSPKFAEILFGGFPLTPDDLYAKSSKTVQWAARDGVYMPMRFVQPVSNYVEGLDGPVVVRVSSKLQTPFVVATNGNLSDGVDYYTAFVSGAVLNETCGISFFMGMSASATIDLKVRRGLEAVPTAGSAWAPFMEQSPLLDSAAMANIVTVAQEGQTAYPARYNDLSLLWSKVIQPLIKAGVRWLAPAAMSWAGA
jgi:hypothetical protein